MRELKNTVERAVYRFGRDDKPLDYLELDPFQAPWKDLSSPSIPPKNQAKQRPQVDPPTPLPSLPMNLRQWQQDQEKEFVIRAMTQAKFNQARAAELLGLSYHQIRGLLKKFDLVGEVK